MIAKIFLSDSLPQIQNILITALKEYGIKKNSPDLMYFDNEAKLGIEQIQKIREFLL